jgi:hypothetical protein
MAGSTPAKPIKAVRMDHLFRFKGWFMVYLTNKFSLGMLKSGRVIDVVEISNAKNMVTFFRDVICGDKLSIVDNEGIARLLGVDYNPREVRFDHGDTIYVAEYSGPTIRKNTKRFHDCCVIRAFAVSVH